ncbi:hypothetical protein AYI68_g971 [Smittium mucronatum]|uniref:Uncharacterized protein n=1 Tax=Smittium mucronatum TaxID=133383 RepID=A0A1R0H6U2_9FUNG|nr:hypothetical protein AYI68_g971 [Smittium mucronatum]
MGLANHFTFQSYSVLCTRMPNRDFAVSSNYSKPPVPAWNWFKVCLGSLPLRLSNILKQNLLKYERWFL